MSMVRRAAIAAAAMARRDALTIWSYRLRLVAQIASACLGLVVFHYVSQLVRAKPFTSPGAYFGFVVVGLLALQAFTVAIRGPARGARQELVAGTFERLLVSPAGPTAALMGTLVFPVVLAMVVGGISLLFAAAVLGLDLRWGTAPLALPLSALIAASAAPFGLFVLAGIVLVKQAEAAASWLIVMLTLIAGVYFPVDLLPGWIRWSSEVQPFTPSIDLMRNVLVGTPLARSVPGELVRLAGSALLLLPIGVLVLRTAIRTAQKQGTVLEY